MKFLPFVLLIVFAACKKDSTPSTTELISQTWSFQKKTLISSVQGTVFEGNTTESFAFDHCYVGPDQVFNPDGSFENGVSAECSLQFRGTWNYQPSDKMINVHFMDGFEDFRYYLVDVSPNKLKVQRWESFGPAAPELLFQYEFIKK